MGFTFTLKDTAIYTPDGEMSRPWYQFFSRLSQGQSSTQAAGTGGGLLLTVPGVIAIAASAAPIAVFPTDESAQKLSAFVMIAPTGADIVCNILVDGVPIGAVTITAGTLSGVGTVGGAIAAGALVTLDITSVGTTLPGSGLTVLVGL